VTDSDPAVVFVDHTSEPGGGEYALRRLVALTGLPASSLLLGEGALADWLRADGAAVELPRRGLGPVGRLRWLRRRLRADPSRIAVSNSLRAAAYVSLVKPRGMRHVNYLRDGVDPRSLGSVKRFVTRLAYRGVGLALTNSEWTRDALAGLSRETPAAVVYTTSGAAAAARAARTEEVGAAAALRLVFVGRLVPWKGPDLLLDAMELIAATAPDDRITAVFCGSPVMGDPAFADGLRARAGRLAAGIEFAGQVEVAPYLASADVLVHCSRRPEPFGQVVVQGLAAGLAVLAPDAGGPAEILAPLAADALYPQDDAAALAAAILRLARDRALLRRLAVAGPGIAAAYRDERSAELFDEALRRFAAGRPA